MAFAQEAGNEIYLDSGEFVPSPGHLRAARVRRETVPTGVRRELFDVKQNGRVWEPQEEALGQPFQLRILIRTIIEDLADKPRRQVRLKRDRHVRRRLREHMSFVKIHRGSLHSASGVTQARVGELQLSGEGVAPSVVVAVAAWLYRMRISRGISQEHLAHLAGIAARTYGRVERAGLRGSAGSVNLETFLRLLTALEPSRQELSNLGMAVLRADVDHHQNY